VNDTVGRDVHEICLAINTRHYDKISLLPPAPNLGFAYVDTNSKQFLRESTEPVDVLASPRFGKGKR
jgi:hypothetical protein